MPVYNVESFLERCIHSVLQQNIYKDGDIQLVIVNDGSTDHSGEIASKLASNYERIHYFFKNNGGLGSARNYGVEKAQGKYIMFLDSDDWLEENVLQDLLFLAYKDDLDLLIYRSQRVYPNRDAKSIEVNYKPERLYSGEELILNSNIEILPCTNLYKREIFSTNRLKFHEGVYYEDPDFYLKFILNSKRIIYYPKMVYNYYYNDQSITVNSSNSHINKKVGDYGRAIMRISNLKFGQSDAIKSKLDLIIEKYQYWFIKMIYDNDVNFEIIKSLIDEYKLCGLYPFVIRQRFKNRNLDAQLFYFNNFLYNSFFYKIRFKATVFIMKIFRRI